jgi:hypothetical protein
MKLLKTFEAYRYSADLKQDIEDIFTESIDSNFEVDVFLKPVSDSDKSDKICVCIEHKDKDWFKVTNDLYDQISYLIDYMNDKFPNMKFNFNGEIYNSVKDDDGIKRTDIENYIGALFSYITLRFE